MIVDPWEAIARPATGYAWLLKDGAARHRLYYGVHQNGACAILFEVKDDHSALVQRSARLVGVETDFRKLTDLGSHGLLLTLKQERDRALFAVLANDLASVVAPIESELQAVQSILNRLTRWQKLFARQFSGILSPEQVRGLMGELATIRYLGRREAGIASTVLKAWEGPLGAAQDFRFPTFCIESKACSSTGNTVKISSEFQLWPQERPIFLTVWRLREDEDNSETLSLRAMAASIASLLDDEAREFFEDRLAEAGYVDLDVYGSPRFILGDPDFYQVVEDFPALHQDNIPSAASRLRYELDVAQIADFRVIDVPEISS